MGYDEDKLPTYYCLSITGGQIVWGIIWIIIINTDFQDINTILNDPSLDTIMYNINTVYEDIHQDFITDIKIIPEKQKCPQNYIDKEMFYTTYNGTKLGCECDEQRYSEFKDLDVVEGECCKKGQLDKFQKCGIDGLDWEGLPCTPDCICFGKEIQPIQKKTFYGWPFDIPVEGQEEPETVVFKSCILRQQGYNFRNKQPTLDKSTQKYKCESPDDKICADFICYPKSTNCPIADIKFSNTTLSDYNEIIIDAKIETKMYIKYLDKKGKMPIIGFHTTGGEGVCKNGQQNFDKTLNNSTYVLENEKRVPCDVLSTIHFKSQLELLSGKYLYSIDPEYVTRLTNLPKFIQNSPKNAQFRHYYKLYNEEFKNISETCQDVLERYEILSTEFKRWQQEDLKDIDRFYDMSSLAYLCACIMMGVPITMSLMKYNRTKGRYFLLTGIILVMVTAFVTSNQFNVYQILDNFQNYEKLYKVIKENSCPEQEEFEKLYVLTQRITKIVNRKIIIWLLVGAFVSSPCAYIVLGIPLILFKPKINKDKKQQKQEEKKQLVRLEEVKSLVIA